MKINVMSTYDTTLFKQAMLDDLGCVSDEEHIATVLLAISFDLTLNRLLCLCRDVLQWSLLRTLETLIQPYDMKHHFSDSWCDVVMIFVQVYNVSIETFDDWPVTHS